ncbi:MAG: anthranilate synthase component I family protein [Planctomycetota bacterium]|nr:MAG: anthranilate synthase component I family protein [Planctomycetota bacterium]
MADRLPLVIEIDRPDIVELFRRLAGLPGCIWLDSADPYERLGRFSYLAADPFAWFSLPATAVQSRETVRRFWCDLVKVCRDFRAEPEENIPPFQGGLAGFFGYEFGLAFEQVSVAPWKAFAPPLCAFGLYDCIFTFDHQRNRAWIVSQGFPKRRFGERFEHARRRAERFLAIAQQANCDEAAGRDLESPSLSPDAFGAVPIEVGEYQAYGNFTRDAYLDVIAKAIEYIRAGDIFQVNLAQQFFAPARCDDVSFYLDLRTSNPAPFGAFFDAGSARVMSSSPELFLRVTGDHVETRPIKGTRRRTGDPNRDQDLAGDLESSEKDRAENVMIVDLLRNDLSRVCLPDSVCVTELCRIEPYATVLQMVSAVEGRLRPNCDGFDLLAASFPGGSITGAPKVRAMEIIAELEPNARGPYCGSLGYLGFDGSAEWNILIRTVTSFAGWWAAPAGGGIVVQSDPELEYEETLIKVRAVLEAMVAGRPGDRYPRPK